jgi:hypothetical protein
VEEAWLERHWEAEDLWVLAEAVAEAVLVRLHSH